VLNQYQRRADLVPNLVSTVQGYASHEKDVLTQVTQARAQVGAVFRRRRNWSMIRKPLPNSSRRRRVCPGALSRLLVVAENYPQLKADAAFRDLQAQLEGTENRITVARNRYIKAVEGYNVSVRTFPNNLTAMIFGYTVKPNFSVDNEKAISTAPKVDFTASLRAPASLQQAAAAPASGY
jgi:LemA protein